jgi:hypothetical protein
MTEESDDWIYDIIPEDQIESIQESFRNIRDNEAAQINLVLSAPRSSAIDLCKTFEKSMKGHLASSVIIIRFMANIIDMIEEELYANGINPYED